MTRMQAYPAFTVKQRPWLSVSIVPEDVEIDVFWVNPDLRDEPITGVLRFCVKDEGHYFSVIGNAGVPVRYAVLWRESRHEVQDPLELDTLPPRRS